MKQLPTLLLALLATSGFFIASSQHFTDQQGITPDIAVVDSGKVIWKLDRIRVYQESENGMSIAELDSEKTEKVLTTIQEINDAVDRISEKHGFSIVLRVDSLPDRQLGRIDFPVEKLSRPKEEVNRNELNRLLKKRILTHRKLDITQHVIEEIENTR